MNLVCNNEEVIIGKPIKVTFYLYNGADGSLYRGDGFDMNNASFDIDSNIEVVNKEFDKNSVTLELCLQSYGSYLIKINFYGCSLSAVLNVYQGFGAFPSFDLVIDS